jgi:hypothetical protein
MAAQQVAGLSDNGTPVRSPRKGARVGPVSELSVFLKVKPGREQLIREVLQMPPAQRAAMEKPLLELTAS